MLCGGLEARDRHNGCSGVEVPAQRRLGKGLDGTRGEVRVTWERGLLAQGRSHFWKYLFLETEVYRDWTKGTGS